MRARIALETYVAERQPLSSTEETPGAVGKPQDPVEIARQQASTWLYENFRDILAEPRQHESEVIRAISQAVARVRLGPDQARRLRDELQAAILGAGVIQQYLDDPAITEIMVVGRDVWIEKGGRLEKVLPLPSREDAFRLAEDLAQKAGHRFQRAQPLLNLTWADGSRVNLVHPVCSAKGASITIRKPDRSRPLELVNLVEAGALSDEAARNLVRWVRGRLNVLIAGSTGSGKTTLLRALANATFTNPTERVIVLEDTEELRLRHPHTVSLVAFHAGDDASGGVSVSLRDLFKNSLRMRPDRLIVGEVRGEEALDAIEAAKSEHGGLIFTMHLRRPEEFGPRMYWISQHFGMGIDKNEMFREVYSAIDVIVQLDKLRDGRRRVTRICEPVGLGMNDLFRWDAESDTLRPVGTLSEDRLAWLRDQQVDAEDGQ